jgi:UPF0755 protein
MVGLAIPLCMLVAAIGVQAEATRLYGPPSSRLPYATALEYSARLLWHDGLLTTPVLHPAEQTVFTIESGEPVSSVADRLRATGLISSKQAFLDFVIYTGQDVTIQAGTYNMDSKLPIVGIAHELQDASPEEVTFVVLPGWRLEEIADSLPTSGLDFTRGEFLAAASAAPTRLDFVPPSVRAGEGLLFPDAYLLPRSTTPVELVERLTSNLVGHLEPDLLMAFRNQGLSAYEAIILASIVEREAVQETEQGQIASVFLNRLRQSMKLDSDATVQYAVGFNAVQNTWWTNPLSAADLQSESPYNTYLHAGLPPSPIANPGMSALRAVADAPLTPNFYFRALCDGSGYHAFAETFEEHLRNACD